MVEVRMEEWALEVGNMAVFEMVVEVETACYHGRLLLLCHCHLGYLGHLLVPYHCHLLVPFHFHPGYLAHLLVHYHCDQQWQLPKR